MLAMREVRDIYHQGVWAVADAFRRLYEMIEVKDEQVQKLIAVATAAHLKKIEGLNTRIFHLQEDLLNRKMPHLRC
jgi:hypothetical protein